VFFASFLNGNISQLQFNLFGFLMQRMFPAKSTVLIHF